MKIAIIGTKNECNIIQIKDLLFTIKEKANKSKKSIVIIGDGNISGIAPVVKKYVLEFGLDFEEYLPFHDSCSNFCPLPAYLYRKSFHPMYFSIRDKIIIDNSDLIFLKEENKKRYKQIINYAKKKEKKVILLGEKM